MQADEPYGAPDDTLWVDTDDYSRYDIVEYTDTATADIEDGEVIVCDGTFTLTMFPSVDGVIATVKNIGTGTITIAFDGTETIDGASTYSLSSQWDVVRMIGYSGNWLVI